MPLALQARLLRVLAEKEVMAVGATKPVPVDVRVVSASHRNLKGLVDAGQFRHDLFYRLNGVVLQIPALREREDKSWVIAQVASIVTPDAQTRFSKDAHSALLAYDWPGNVRELISVLEVGLALSDGNSVELTDLPEQITA